MGLTELTWSALTSAVVLTGLLVGLIELAKLLPWVNSSPRIFLVGFALGQLFAQVAFWHEVSPWTGKVVADAFLAGFLASVAAIGAHTIGKKLLVSDNKP